MISNKLFNFISLYRAPDQSSDEFENFIYKGSSKNTSRQNSGFFSLFFEPPPPLFLSGFSKKLFKVSFSNTQYEKLLNAKSSLKQIQDAHFHRSFN